MSLVLAAPLFAAAGWSLLYLLCGGGVVGAIVLFFVLKSVGAYVILAVTTSGQPRQATWRGFFV